MAKAQKSSNPEVFGSLQTGPLAKQLTIKLLACNETKSQKLSYKSTHYVSRNVEKVKPKSTVFCNGCNICIKRL
jgi:hypothetical protein